MNMTILPYKYQRNMPCKDCENRHVNCHSTCKNYTEYKKLCERQKEKIRDEMDKESDLKAYKVSIVEKTQKRFENGRHKRLMGQL